MNIASSKRGAVCSASTQETGYECEKALDSEWNSRYRKAKNAPSVGQYIQVTFARKYLVNHVKLMQTADNAAQIKTVQLTFSDTSTETVSRDVLYNYSRARNITQEPSRTYAHTDKQTHKSTNMHTHERTRARIYTHARPPKRVSSRAHTCTARTHRRWAGIYSRAYTRTQVHRRVHTPEKAHARKHTLSRVNGYAHAHKYGTHKNALMHMHIHTSTHTHTFVHYKRAYTHTHTCTRTHMYTRTQAHGTRTHTHK